MKFAFAIVAAGTAALAFKVGTATATGHTAPHASTTARADVTSNTARVAARAKRRARPRKPGEVLSQTDALNEVVQFYCTDCHSDDNAKDHGNLSLEHFDVSKAATDVHTTEKVIRKLRAQMMPPPGLLRPPADTLNLVVSTLETVVDKAAKPTAGEKTFQRLNRAEYENAIHDLVGIDIDAGDYLPLDTKSANFDNIADVQSLSATLLEAYLNAAAAVARMAVGDKTATAIPVTYTASPFASQHPWDRIEGAPFGTRGGVVADHVFPADGSYIFTMKVDGGTGTRLEDIDISIDGKRAVLLKYEGGVNRTPGSADLAVGEDLYMTDPVEVKSGQHRVAAAFVRRTEGPYEDLIRPHEWSMASDGNSSAGTTSPPHVRDLTITGPKNITGVSETPARKIVFSCRPTKTLTGDACAEQIINRLGMRAYRRPLTQHDRDGLMQFYKKGSSNGGDFEGGVRLALQAMLSNPSFVFRFESTPANATAGKDYKISDLDLASRLSFFLWGSIPDEQLLSLAKENRLSEPTMMRAQVKRMLADPRSEALATRFAGQWLRLQDLDKVHPDAFWFPDFNQQLADAMKRETELFFNDIVKQDRSILDLFTANYTFVNERLARHYDIPNISGDYFRKVSYPDSTRRGILGQGSMLVQTSIANRTSPVLRGKWVMEVLLGSPPPPPPPNVPTLDETADGKDGVPLTTRQRTELHRKAATCRSCHVVIDPIGLALDNFDVTGRWRYLENGQPLDTRGQLYDGTPVSNLPGLVNALVKRPVPLVRTFTENLMAYAIGRRTEDFDQPTIRAIGKAAAANDYRFSTFVNGVVNSTAFRSKRADVVSADADNKQEQNRH